METVLMLGGALMLGLLIFAGAQSQNRRRHGSASGDGGASISGGDGCDAGSDGGGCDGGGGGGGD
jgi:hypothetical protein